MEVILLQKIRNLGALGDVVRVRAGFARNYLIPYGKATIATEAGKARFEAERAELERKQNEGLAAAKDRAEKIGGMTLQIVRKVSEESKLFGSVTIRDICDAAKAVGMEIERSEVHLPSGPIKDIGDHEIAISLHPEVNFKLIVSVVGEK